MCGLAGFWFFRSFKLPNNSEKLLFSMGRALQQRGPDYQGYLVDNEQNLALLHTRLSIVDRQARSNQPFVLWPTFSILLFNGQIYNHRVLRAELRALGYPFQTESDTEVIIVAFQAWGIACLERLDGMFACVIFDAKEKKLFLIRDRFGIKPLYFSVSNQSIAFASQINALLDLPWIEPRLSPYSCQFFLTYMATFAPLTLFDNIFKIPAGFYLQIDWQGNCQAVRWYQVLAQINNQPTKLTLRSAQDQLDFLIRTAIDKQTDQLEVPAGVFFSGGVDSSLLAKFAGQRIDTLESLCFASPLTNWQEKNSIRQFAYQLGLNFDQLNFNPVDLEQILAEFVDDLDEPVADPVALSFWLLTRFAKQKKCKVLFVGEGVDELFAGYPLYRKHQLLQSYVSPILQTGLQKLLAQTHFFLPLQGYAKHLTNYFGQTGQLFSSGAVAFGVHQFSSSIRWSEQQDFWLEKFYGYRLAKAEIFTYLDDQLAHAEIGYFNRLAFFELSFRLPELLLMRADKMAMRQSVEVRVPYLDHHLVEFALSLPDHFKYAQGQHKLLFKQVAQRHLPLEIVYQAKSGFSFPLQCFADKLNLAPETYKRLGLVRPPTNNLFQTWTAWRLLQYIDQF